MIMDLVFRLKFKVVLKEVLDFQKWFYGNQVCIWCIQNFMFVDVCVFFFFNKLMLQDNLMNLLYRYVVRVMIKLNVSFFFI